MKLNVWIPVVLMMTSCSMTTFAVRSGDYEYEINPDYTTATITGYYGTNTAIAVPNVLDSNLVTRIDNYAFSANTTLAVVYLPDCIHSIGAYAFSGCSSCMFIELPQELETIGEYAFYGCSNLPKIVIPHSVTSLGMSAFQGCSGLTNVVIGSGITTIKQSVFSGTGAMRLIVPATVKTIEDQAFLGSQIESLQLNSGGVKSIAGYAFKYCSNLNSVYLGTELESIGYEAFASCPRLETLYLPATLTSIDKSAVSGCASFSTFQTHPYNPMYSVESGILYDLNKTKIIIYPPARSGTYETPETLTIIEPYTFVFCSGLTGITLANSITNLGAYAFYGCENMTVVNLSTHLQAIGEYAFQSCRKLASIEIPDHVVSLGDQAFGDCQALARVKIGAGLSRLGRNVFSSCSSLKSITIPENILELGDGVFFGSGLERITIYPGVTTISTYAFAYSGQLKRIYFMGTTKPNDGSDIFMGVHADATVYVREKTGAWEGVDLYAGLPVQTWTFTTALSVATPRIDSEGIHLTGYGSDHLPHTIERSTNLVEGIWIPLTTAFPRSGIFDYVDQMSAAGGTAFYRITRPVE